MKNFEVLFNNIRGNEKVSQMYLKQIYIPFGHDYVPDGRPTIIQDYNSSGTPWFMINDPSGESIFSNFGISAEEANRVLGQKST